MKSMTGFGYAELCEETFQLVLEMKSYNNRYLDFHINLPPGLSALEPRIRGFLTPLIKRGRVEVYVKVHILEEDLSVHLDRQAVRAYMAALTALKQETGIQDALRLDHLLSFSDIIKPDKKQDMDMYWRILQPVLEKVAAEFESHRVREGEQTARDIASQLSRIRTLLHVTGAHAAAMEEKIQNNLRERFEQVMGNLVDENRILAETAVLLAKFSVNEEMVRLQSHLDAFDKEAAAAGPVGKKLDFLCQEIGREINTIGSKSMIQEINHSVVESKEALDNIREQLRNVE